MTDTFTPALAPVVGTTYEKQPRIIKISYGDGYEARAGDGINATPLMTDLNFTALTNSEAEAIDDFFMTQGGYIPFYYTLPDEASPRLFVCEKWTRTPGSGGADAQVRASLREVFDVV